MCCLPINQHGQNMEIESPKKQKSEEYQRGFDDGEKGLPAQEEGLEYLDGYLEGLLGED